MLPSETLIGAVTEAVDLALRGVVARLATGSIEQEPDFTSQFVGEVYGELRRARLDGYSWRIKVLTDRGRGAQETKYGADLLVVQHFDTNDYKVTKGFLAQAKLDGRSVNRREIVKQCERMLEVTPDAFVFRYSTVGIGVASASATVASSAAMDELRWKSFDEFLRDFMTSFVGDRRLTAATAAELEALRAEHRARVGVHVGVTGVVR